MAKFEVETTPKEKQAVLDVIAQMECQTVSVEAIAERTGMKASRVRYAIIDLIDAGKIERIATKAFNKRYVRYAYRLL